MSGRDVVVRLLDPPLHEFLDNPRELEVAIKMCIRDRDHVDAR